MIDEVFDHANMIFSFWEKKFFLHTAFLKFSGSLSVRGFTKSDRLIVEAKQPDHSFSTGSKDSFPRGAMWRPRNDLIH